MLRHLLQICREASGEVEWTHCYVCVYPVLLLLNDVMSAVKQVVPALTQTLSLRNGSVGWVELYSLKVMVYILFFRMCDAGD